MGTTATQNPGDNAIAVLITPDKRDAIISQEHGNGTALITNLTTPGNLNVVRLHDPATNGSASTPIGAPNLGHNIAGAVVAPNCRYLYATSERYTAIGESQNTSEPCSELKPAFFSVVNLYRPKTDPSRAHHDDIPAGYAPVRVRTSPDGKFVWVASRESNALLAYDAERLHSSASWSAKNATGALLATVQVGTSPVDFIFARNGMRILTTDSNRFHYPDAVTGLSVIDV